ncbi:phosphoribosylamine--glycine ligase [Fervidobacterium sp.]
MKKVLIIGSGGREHAIGWAFKNAGFEVSFFPGNAGTKFVGKNVLLDNFDRLVEFDIVIPGSEEFLVKGVADDRRNVFGPDSSGARLEGSKCFSKLFMQRHDIPTAKFSIAKNSVELEDALKTFQPPYVIKADGLAQGKGVIIAENFSEAMEKGTKLINGTLISGVSGPVVVDEFLKGWELSAIAIVNGKDFALLPFTKDYKRAFTGNAGPNTGGMGAYGPVRIDNNLKRRIEDVFGRTLDGLKKENINYRGFLYIGLMIVENEPYVLEYNVRLGDPETEVIVTMAPDKFVENVVKAFSNEKIKEYYPENYAVDVVLASKGYPDNPTKGQKIEFVSNNGFFFFAGVKENNGELIVNGGRVLHSIGIDKNLEKAREKAYENIKTVHFEGMFYREDIAK